MLLWKIWWVNCDKQHWEDEETGEKQKKNRVGWKCPNYFSLRLCWRRNLRNLKSCWQMPRLTCNLVRDAVVVCWGVYSDFWTFLQQWTELFSYFCFHIKTTVTLRIPSWLKYFFWAQFWKNIKNWVYSMAFKSRTDSMTTVHAYFCVKFMVYPYWESLKCVTFLAETCG